MSNAILGPAGVAGRYQTHRSQLMTLIVTRQGQHFVTTGGQQLCDVELISTMVSLVGEPGLGNKGTVTGPLIPHNTTYNQLHAVNEAGVTSTVYGITGENRVLAKTHLDHSEVEVGIVGMMQPHQFRTDQQQDGIGSSLLIPTDHGIIMHQGTWPPFPIMLENVHLQQNLRVETIFSGTWPKQKRIARFTEDWADTAGGTKRNADGTVRYFINNSEGQASVAECQVPSNCINFMKLVFKITPRTEL